MPEYSSTTITPADGVQVPSMNGSAAGNFLLSALRDYILASKGQANGLASLDGNGKLTAAQLPDLADDVIVVDSYSTLPAIGTASKIYITADNNKMYRWDPELTTPDYVDLSVDLTEYARIVDIQDGNIQAGVAVKAFQDAMGRAIITTYETKADASDLKSAIDRNTAEIENLKQTSAQTEITVSYPDDGNYPALMPNLVHQKSAKYAEIKSINGKSRAWNQLIRPLSSTYADFNNATGSFSDGVATFTATSQRGGLVCTRVHSPLPNVANKKVLIKVEVKTTTATTSVRVYAYGGYAVKFCESSTAWQTILFITTTNSSWGSDLTNNNVLRVEDNRSGSWDSVQVRNVICRDLTPILSDWNTSDITTENIPLMVKQIPDLLKYDAYGTSIVDTTVGGVKAIGKNLWDEQWRLGYYSSTTGVFVPGSSVANLNPIRVLPSTGYYLTVEYNFNAYFYDADGNFLSWVTATTHTFNTPVGCYYVNFRIVGDYGSTYHHDLCLMPSSLTDKSYSPYMTDTLTLPTSVTIRSAGTVADTDELNVEVLVDGQRVNKRRQTQRVSVDVDLSTLNWNYISWGSDHAYISYDIQSLVLPPSDNTQKAEITASKYIVNHITGAGGAYADSHAGQIFVSYEGVLGVTDTATPSGKFTYALATESVTLLDPIINNTIQVECNGTVETVQNNTYPDDSPAPTIDNSMTVNYDLIP